MATLEEQVSVVVVSYNTSAALRKCLEAIESHHDVIVVDNGSTDGSPEMVQSDFPDVRLIQNTDNRGFGAANNQGMALAQKDLVLFLNSDCYAHPGAISRLALAFRDASVVAAGGMLLNPDGSLQDSIANRLTLWTVFLEQTFLGRKGYWRTQRALEEAGPGDAEVPQIMGACLMIRPIERFDERIFLYCEDTELCARLSTLR